MERNLRRKGREFKIHLLLKYWKSRDFTSDLSTTCNLDTYLRWHYVLENFQLRNKKMDNLKAMNIHATVEKEDEDLWVNIDLGKLEKKVSEADVSRIKDSVTTELMLDTGTLVTNSFLAIDFDRHEAVKLMMEKSRKEMGSELWLYPDKDTDVIYCVYPATRRTKVDSCIQEVTKTLKEGERIESLPLVFSKLFEQNNIKLKMKKEYRLIMTIDCMVSENKCRVALKGTMFQVEKGWSWINTKIIDSYNVNEIGFKDIKKQGANINEEIIVQDVLSQAEFEIVSWYINESCEKIGICSTDRVVLDKAIAALKRGIRKEEFPMELYQSLSDVQAVREGRAILKRTDKLVQVMGTDKSLAGIKQFVQELENNRQANKTAKQGQINKDNDQNQHSNVTEATIPFVVDNLHVFERLCNSEELKDYADKLKVKLSTKHKDRRGFFLTGSNDSCVKVKELLKQMVGSLNQEKFSANVSRDHWTLSCGHGITVQYPINMLDVNFVVGVDTVPPELAEFDREQKTLHLPEWIDGCKKETEKTETCLKELLQFSVHKNLYKIQIAMPEVHKKIAKHFTHGLFSLFSGEEFKKKPIQLFICTDSQDMYTYLIETCKQSKKMLSSVLHRSASVLEKHETPTPDIEISVISGHLNEAKADVIVNTTSTDLNLSNGKVSSALLQSAGQELQTEVRRKYPNGIKYGEFVVTSGYRLQGCKFVFHGALESFSAAGNIKGLYKFVVDCLLEANRRKCKTIAFPAIGTGKLGYPQHQVAHAMFSAVRSFESKNTHLKEVLFVIYHLDKYTVKEFRKQHECNEAVKGLVKNCGKVRISIDYGIVTHVFTTSIIYVWERKSLHSVKLKEHALLSHVGADVQKLWTNHRTNKEIRDDSLTTPGGKLPVSCIVHMFCQDDLESLKVAIMEGLHITNSCDSVTLFFDENINLLSYGESLVDVFQDCIKSIQMSKTSLHYVSMSLDNIDLVAKFQVHMINSNAIEYEFGSEAATSSIGNQMREDRDVSDGGETSNASEYELGSDATSSTGNQMHEERNVSGGGETNQDRICGTGSECANFVETFGIHEEEDDSDGDETDSTDEAQVVVVIVTYRRKIRNKLESFSRPIDLNLSTESYLKWQYICRKPDLLQHRIREMGKVAEKAEYDDEKLRLFLGKHRNDPNFDTLTKEIQAIFLEDADHLVVSWFPMLESQPGKEIYTVLCKVLETSVLQERNEIYTEMSESGLIRLVYDVRHTHDVSEVMQTVTKKLDENVRPEYTSKQICLNAVLGQVFDQKQVNIDACTKFASVRMKYEINQSTNTLTVDLYGPQEEVEEMHTWLNKTYVVPYKCESLPFADIQIKDEFVNTSKVLVEHLKTQSYKDLLWTVNDYTREVSFCSIHEFEVKKAVSDAKDCMYCESITIKNDSLEATEEIIKWLTKLGELLDRKVSLGVTLERNELRICITGGKVNAHSCIRKIKAYLHEGCMQTQ